jgi:sulfur-oxidizing protein SoxY
MKIFSSIAIRAPLLAAALLSATGGVAGEAPPADPLRSVQWENMYGLYLAGRPVVFDNRVLVLAPQAAENSLEVPVLVDAGALGRVEKILVIADLNPLPKVLEFYPRESRARIGFRVKLQQSTPIRAAVLTADDKVWHVGGVWVDAAGGGCTAPSVGSGGADWVARLGQVHGRLWDRGAEQSRLRFDVIHPMDTGLASGIPVFHVENIEIRDQDQLLAEIRPFEPVSENPVFTLDLPGRGAVQIRGRDNNGNRFRASVPPPAAAGKAASGAAR